MNYSPLLGQVVECELGEYVPGTNKPRRYSGFRVGRVTVVKANRFTIRLFGEPIVRDRYRGKKITHVAPEEIRGIIPRRNARRTIPLPEFINDHT